MFRSQARWDSEKPGVPSLSSVASRVTIADERRWQLRPKGLIRQCFYLSPGIQERAQRFPVGDADQQAPDPDPDHPCRVLTAEQWS